MAPLSMLETGKVLNETYSGNYRAQVIDNGDITKTGRVKVRVQPMMREIRESVLPWAIPATPIGGGAKDKGEICIPDTGSIVWVFFEAGDPMKPVYFASSISRKDDEALFPKLAQDIADESVEQKESTREIGVMTADDSTWDEPGPQYNAEYPSNKVIKTSSGHIVEFDDTAGEERINIYHKAGTYIQINKDGSLHIHSEGDMYEITTQDRNMYVNSKLNISTDDDINLYSKNANTLIRGVLVKLQNNQLATVDSLVKQAIIPLINTFIGVYNTHTHPDPASGSTGAPSALGTTISQDGTTVTQVVKGE